MRLRGFLVLLLALVLLSRVVFYSIASLYPTYPIATGVVYAGWALIVFGAVFRVFYGRWPHRAAGEKTPQD